MKRTSALLVQRGGVIVAYARILHVGCGSSVRGARAHSGRDVTATQYARHSPRPFVRATPKLLVQHTLPET